jgi:hypothetical protein
VAAAQRPTSDLAQDAERITAVIVSVAREMAPVRAAAQHKAAVEASGRGAEQLRTVMARRVARRALDNIVTAVTAGSSEPQQPALALAMNALASAPQDVWERFVNAADDAIARIPHGTPVAVVAKAVLQTRDVRQAWLLVVTAVTTPSDSSKPGGDDGSYQSATSFVHPYLCLVREFVRLRTNLISRLRKL